jgi:protein required for attachment to host cells
MSDDAKRPLALRSDNASGEPDPFPSVGTDTSDIDKENDVQLPHGATVAVADGEKLLLFRNAGDEGGLKLQSVDEPNVTPENAGSGARHHSSSANPDDAQSKEDGFAAGIADMLNTGVLGGKITALFIVAAPRTLGELRQHYHKTLSAILIGELAKDLTGHSVHDIETAVSNG